VGKLGLQTPRKKERKKERKTMRIGAPYKPCKFSAIRKIRIAKFFEGARVAPQKMHVGKMH